MIIWLLLLLFIGALYVLIKGNIIKPEYGNSIFAIGCLVGLVFYGITDIKGCEKESANKWVLSKMLSAPKCDRDSAEEFATERIMKGARNIFDGYPQLISEKNCEYHFLFYFVYRDGSPMFSDITVKKINGSWQVDNVKAQSAY